MVLPSFPPFVSPVNEAAFPPLLPTIEERCPVASTYRDHRLAIVANVSWLKSDVLLSLTHWRTGRESFQRRRKERRRFQSFQLFRFNAGTRNIQQVHSFKIPKVVTSFDVDDWDSNDSQRLNIDLYPDKNIYLYLLIFYLSI